MPCAPDPQNVVVVAPAAAVAGAATTTPLAAPYAGPVSYRMPPLLAGRLHAVRERPIEPTEKGFGVLAAPGPSAASLAAARPPVHAASFSYPLLTLRETALAGNIEAMAGYCARAGVLLAPHGKTAMSPELAARQLAHGAWGITVATIGQLRTYRAFGFDRLLLASELVDEAGIAWLAAELAADPGFEAYCYVDSAEGVAILDRALTRHPAGRRLPVLVEIGHPGGRTGCRTDAQALAVARTAAATGTLRVAGAAGYEGSIGPGDQQLALVTSFCRRLRALAGQLADLDGPGDFTGELTGELIVTAGGSAFFDVVARELTAGGDRRITAILRSGAYLTHDHGYYAAVSPAARGAVSAGAGSAGATGAGATGAGSTGAGAAAPPALRPALELWAQVLSRPEPGLALLGAGRRDAGFDKGLPVPLRAIRRDGGGTAPGRTDLAGSKVTELNDQHAYLRLDEAVALAPGDLVALGISHPCTTLDKWRVIPVVDDDDMVTDIVHAYF
jgi:D-serine deaminase-like pyridoxal phosphate-dependent protein